MTRVHALEAEAGDGMIPLWKHMYGEQVGAVGLFSGTRPGPGSKRLESTRQAYFAWPAEAELARAWIEREAAAHRETYHCGHLLTDRRRIRENAAPLAALYVDGDGAKVRSGMPTPTTVVESSPGREQFYWGLSRPLPPEVGERLNRRLAMVMGADRSGWDLTQLLRPSGTHNHKTRTRRSSACSSSGTSATARTSSTGCCRRCPRRSQKGQDPAARRRSDRPPTSLGCRAGYRTLCVAGTGESIGAVPGRTWPPAWQCS